MYISHVVHTHMCTSTHECTRCERTCVSGHECACVHLCVNACGHECLCTWMCVSARSGGVCPRSHVTSHSLSGAHGPPRPISVGPVHWGAWAEPQESHFHAEACRLPRELGCCGGAWRLFVCVPHYCAGMFCSRTSLSCVRLCSGCSYIMAATVCESQLGSELLKYEFSKPQPVIDQQQPFSLLFPSSSPAPPGQTVWVRVGGGLALRHPAPHAPG